MKNCRLHTAATMTALFCLAGMTVTSCSSDDDGCVYPDTVISLNMMNESNGDTMLGDSNVFINNADNFTSPSSSAVIGSMGRNGNYTAAPVLSQLAKEVAVNPGEFYQVFNDSDIRMFASGKRAFSVGGTYYNMYVADWISDAEGDHIGAKVSFNMMTPEVNGLPKWNEVVGTLTHVMSSSASWTEPDGGCSIEFPSGSEINVDYNGMESYISIEVNGNVVTTQFTNNRPNLSGQAYLYVRDGIFFTRVIIAINYVART